MPTLIYARADQPTAGDEPTDAPIKSLQDALKTATPGTTIKLLPGRFTNKITMRRLHGGEYSPIVISGSSPSATVQSPDGTTASLSESTTFPPPPFPTPPRAYLPNGSSVPTASSSPAGGPFRSGPPPARETESPGRVAKPWLFHRMVSTR